MWAPILDSEKEQTEFSFTMQRDAVLSITQVLI